MGILMRNRKSYTGKVRFKNNPDILVMSFPVTNISISTAWGNGVYVEWIVCDTGIDLTNKTVFSSYVASDAMSCWIGQRRIIDSTKIEIGIHRGSTGTVSGTINLMIVE